MGVPLAPLGSGFSGLRCRSIPTLRFGTRLQRVPTIPNVRSRRLFHRLYSLPSFCKAKTGDGFILEITMEILQKNVYSNFIMKPLIKYRGGKSKEIPNIQKHIPQFSGKYIEPFFGGGALYFYLEPKNAIINDINEKLISFYKGVQTDYQTLRNELDNVEKIYERNSVVFEFLKVKRCYDKS